MANRHKIAEPVYQKIAIDIAEKIVEGKYRVGEKISGRSVLAGQYSVSPETIRRAVFILKDLSIVGIESGSGITIISAQNAADFVSRFKELTKLTDIKTEIDNLIDLQKQQQLEFSTKVNELFAYIEHFRFSSPILPYEIKITKKCRFLGQMISEINFWQSTGVTVVAIKRNGDLIVSPGPYASFEENDIFILVGQKSSAQIVNDYLYKDE
ncbi:MAG TPA: GntR family transcriptional regulator [Candidatus Avacidaminococcus intestinavium]|uniref:GntR family transcriptional regulator n=1 Tax=Candidatus Avacidaminococcus intestinavium TaxID=2840684 RepID=A0A9D1SLV8_9FIRM|nr:GntR family transcriptional regulator [Candidatus Avacidaminococcus intestinavium]